MSDERRREGPTEAPERAAAGRADEGRRTLLKAIGVGGAALLVPAQAIAQSAGMEGGVDGQVPDGGAVAQSVPKFKSITGRTDRMGAKETSFAKIEGDGVRLALDVHRDSRSGEVFVQYGSGSTTVGTGLQALRVQQGSPPKLPAPDANGNLTLTLVFQVVCDTKGGVSIITPGGDPGG